MACLGASWAAALGRETPDADPLTAVMLWLRDNIDLVFTGPEVGQALDFPNAKIDVTQTAA